VSFSITSQFIRGLQHNRRVKLQNRAKTHYQTVEKRQETKNNKEREASIAQSIRNNKI